MLGEYEERERRRSFNEKRIGDLTNLYRYRFACRQKRLSVEDEVAFLRVAAPHLRATGGEPAVQFWIETRCPRAIASLGLDRLARIAGEARRYVRATQAGIMLEIACEEREAIQAWTVRFYGQTAKDIRARKRDRDREAARRKRQAAGARPQSESLSKLKPWEILGISRSKFYALPAEERERIAGQVRRYQKEITRGDEVVQPAEAAEQRAVGGAPEGAPATPIPAGSHAADGTARSRAPSPQQRRPRVLGVNRPPAPTAAARPATIEIPFLTGASASGVSGGWGLKPRPTGDDRFVLAQTPALVAAPAIMEAHHAER